MTPETFNAWLLEDAVERVVLVEAMADKGLGVDEPVYLSTSAYITLDTDVPANTAYLPAITDVTPVKESLSLEANATLSMGSIEVSNHEGDLDEWLNWVFDGRPVTVSIGSAAWPREDFQVIYKGVVTSLEVSGNDAFNLPITGSLQRLNGALNDQVDADDQTLPLALGEVSNVEPVLIDPANLVYQVSTRPIGGIIEVRDRGLPVNFSQNLKNATFQLGAMPFGQVTCSVFGDAGVSGVEHTDEIGPLIRRLATEFGPDPLSPDEIDYDSFTSFEAANTQCVGVYVDERENLLNVLSLLARSVGSAVATSADGRLRIHQLREPSAGASVMTVSPYNMAQDSFRVRSKLDILTTFKMGYNRNYSPSAELSAGVPVEHQRLLTEEWRYVTASDPALVEKYKHTKEPEAELTALQVLAESQAECSRWWSLFSQQRYIYTFTGFAECLQLQLGQDITVEYPRYGFESGKAGLIVELSKNWLDNTVEVGILV